MSTYESDPNLWDGSLNTGSATPTKADPVGKRYGAKDLGSVGGLVKGEGNFNEINVEIRKTEVASLADINLDLPPYSQITEIWCEVTEAFGTGDTFQPDMATLAITAAVVPVDALGIFPITVSATLGNLQSGATAEAFTIDGALLDDATTTGACKLVVRYVTM